MAWITSVFSGLALAFVLVIGIKVYILLAFQSTLTEVTRQARSGLGMRKSSVSGPQLCEVYITQCCGSIHSSSTLDLGYTVALFIQVPNSFRMHVQ